MTTLSLNDISYTAWAAPRAPKTSFAARLVALQARQEQAPHLTAIFGVAVRGALALVPSVALAWLFVTV